MQATEHVGDDPDLFLDDEERSDFSGPSSDDTPPWRILIVDDDVDIHVVTKFALSGTNFKGRRLSFLHAYSAGEGLDKLRDTPDIALVLLDVAMETSDAGLLFARLVRDELHNRLVRIVLRTGQPGQAFEHSIIVEYDINDFWSKADLTTRKLFTTVIASLRAYATLAEAARARDDALAKLARVRQILSVVDRQAAVITFDAQGRILDANSFFCQIAGVTIDQLRGRDLHLVHPAPFPQPLASAIIAALVREGSWSGKLETARCWRCSVQAFKASDSISQQYIAVAMPIDGREL